ncbi:LysR family transcriptional regulator [Streptococcus mutans]|nr:LysR family transcriptional regulator [Streptococcus mutans]MCB4996733.1 LysR family transcriptional regulator [Streptococcus mutans]MCB5064850.1 LysR family transcriptional regulator [Streptococcus mutans]MCB5120918.1 LysR family transcriptional regulator [Streptococcus mutans]MCB5133969.1 LysR family transcriptional regulator [Streptococcus mutans]
MNLNDLTIFLKIYETGSLNKSSKILGYAQSNISARLKSMEEELGTILFFRKYNGILPTEQGRKFYSFAQQTISELNNFKNGINSGVQHILTSEMLLNIDIQTEQKIDIAKDEIDIKRTSEIPSQIGSKVYDLIYCFQRLKNLSSYQMLQKKLEAAYFYQDLDLPRQNLPLLVNKDPACPFRKQSLHDFANSRKIIQLDSFENILRLVELGKGLTLLPFEIGRARELEHYSHHKKEIIFYSYQLIR